ncbi:unnamed protein product [Rotaria magnacalcarata]|uniref:NHL repeat containing protein n=3 Tax=Rotaria magnacalcarata TaxID=392030 RepID=A0A819VH11_9BILA|nr:unnamed protein product [Rotaria magnacalcarata]
MYISTSFKNSLLNFTAPITTTTMAPATPSSNQVCPTAYWNSTFTIVAGSTAAASTALNRLNSPTDITFDGYGNMYVVDTANHRIQLFPPGSTSSTSAVNVAGFTTTGGSGLSEFNTPSSMAVDDNGTMYILDTNNFRVVKWIRGQPLGFTVAGGRGTGTTLDKIGTSYAIYLDDQSNIYISEYANHRVTKWFNGNLTAGIRIAGTSVLGNTTSQLKNPWGIYVDANNTLYVVDQGNHRVQKWTPGSVNATTLAGESGVAGAWSYQFNLPTDITFDQYNNMYIMDSGNDRIQRWWPGSTYGVTVAAAVLSNSKGIAFDPFGGLAVADYSNHRIVLFPAVCPSTTTTTPAPLTNAPNQVCGTALWSSAFRIVAGTTASAGATATLLNAPIDVTFDGYGNMYVVDFSNHRIQRFRNGSSGTTAGVTVAGFTTAGGGGLSEFNNPSAVALDNNGTMYILDRDNFRVVKWLAGQPLGFTVAGGRGTGTTLDKIGTSYAIYLDDQSNVYISENSNHRVTKWLNGNLAAGTRIAGNSTLGSTPAQLNSPWGIYIDGNYTLYVVDRGNHRVQMWSSGATTGLLIAGESTVAGAWSYQFNSPTAITFDQYNNMFIMDSGNNRIQRWWPGSTYGVTMAAAVLSNPRGMAFDPYGNLVVADYSNHRMVLFPVTCRK